MDIEDIFINSDLYKTFEEDDIAYTKDKKYLENIQITSINDLDKILYLLHFWGVKPIPWKVYDYLFKNNELDDKKKYKSLLKKYNDFQLFDELKVIINCQNTKLLNKICKFGYINQLKWYYKYILDTQKYKNEKLWTLDL